MSAKRPAPCGTWPSPLDPSTVAGASVRLGGVCLDTDDGNDGGVYWIESRPAQQGRLTLLRKRGKEAAEEILPSPFSVRTRVHEYGGGAFVAVGGVVFFCNDADQQLYRLDTRATAPRIPQVITHEPRMRFADLQVDTRRRRVLCVVEAARDGREPENFLAEVSLDTGTVGRLTGGADFYAFPRLDAGGGRLAYLAWNHPAMPWDSCELYLAEIAADGSLATPVRVAGGSAESIFQPAWSSDGALCFVSDRSGYANLYRRSADGTARCLCAMAAEFSTPLWVFGVSTYAWLDPKTLVCTYQQNGFWHLARLDADRGTLTAVKSTGGFNVGELTELGMIFARNGHAVFVGGSPAEAPALFLLDGDRAELLHRPATREIPADLVSRPRSVDFATAHGATAHGLHYPPAHVEYQPLPGEKPPLLVISHGGPTGSASTALSPTIQFWTSRGFAVLDVNYRGSTGYGRTYRKMLDGEWGVFDVEDCVAGARALAAQGLVDGRRMAIRGSSAGGLTVLCALAFHDAFSAGASYYGVCDLVALATDTHKFESRYLDTLVGRYPECADLYRARSPLYAADRITCPVIFFQGTEDRVVPPSQAKAMAEALRSRGLEAPLYLFPGEQHGFRREETIVAALGAELDFYRKVFGIVSPDPDR